MINVKQLVLPTLHQNIVRRWLEEVRRRQHELKLESFQIFGQDKLGDIAAYVMHQIAVRCLPHASIAVEKMGREWKLGPNGGCPGEGKRSEATPGELGVKHIPITFFFRWRCQPAAIATQFGVNESVVHDAIDVLYSQGLLSYDDGDEMLIDPGYLHLAPVSYLFDSDSNSDSHIYFAKIIEDALDGVLPGEPRL